MAGVNGAVIKKNLKEEMGNLLNKQTVIPFRERIS